MASVAVHLDGLPGTEAAIGRAGHHILVVDRPEGRAGGLGLGFNGAELLAFALGGCLANDLRYAAHARGIALGRLAVVVTVDLDGDPIRATGARMEVDCADADGHPLAALVERAAAVSMALTAVSCGIPVTLDPGATAA